MTPASAYRPGREIARGGMGAVLDARDQKLGRSVAMKVMLRRNASEEEQQRFLQEARVLGQLAHPNIVPVHDVGTDEQGRLFYTMKLVVGVTLHEVIGKLKAGDKDTLAKYPLNALLTAFQKVCDAVAFAHSRGIIHRDLKPQNIMVGEFGEVLVMDWGLAKILPGSPAAEEAAKTLPLRGQLGQTGPTGTPPLNSPAAEEQATLASGEDQATVASGAGNASAPKLAFGSQQPEPAAPSGVYATMEGAVMGTPHFMSPEQAEGKIAELDGRSDIFSLGGILYALLTLRPPVEGDSLEEILSKVRSGTIAPPTAFNAPSSTTQTKPNATGTVTEPRKIHPLPHCPDGKVPAALSAVTMKALTRDKAQRYQSVAEFTRDIVAYQGGFATSAENANALTLLRLFIHRHRALTGAASVVVLLTIGFMAKVISSEKKATANAEQAEANAKTAREHEAQAKANAKTAEENAAKAKAAEAVALEKGEAARRSAAEANLALTEAALREANGPLMQAALKAVPEDLRDATWRYLLAQSDTSIAQPKSQYGQFTHLAADPRRPGVFAMLTGQGKIQLIDVRHGRKLLEFATPFAPQINDGVSALAFSPDGERIAVGRAGAATKGGIVIHSARDGKKLQEWDAPRTSRLSFSPDGKMLLQGALEKAKGSPTRLNAWDASSGRQLWSFEGSVEMLGVFTPDSQQVVALSHWTSSLLSANDGSVVRSLGKWVPRSVAAHPNGKMIVVGENDGSIRGVSLADAKVLFEFRPQKTPILQLAFTPDGARFVSVAVQTDGRQAIEVWNAATGAPLQVLLGGSGPVSAAGVHPISAELLVTGPTPHVWSLAGAKWNLLGIGHARAAFWGNDDQIFAPTASGGGALLSLQGATPKALWVIPNGPWLRAMVSADGRFALTGPSNFDKPLTLLKNPGTQVETVATFTPPEIRRQVRLSPTGDRVVSVVEFKVEVNVYDTTTGKSLTRLDVGGLNRVNDIGWSSDGRQLLGVVTAKSARGNEGSEERIVVWDATSGKILQSATNATAMDVIALAPDGRRFAEAGADKRVRIRDAATLAVQQEFRAHDAGITALAWHPTKSILASASEDLSIRVWDLETGARLEDLHGFIAPPTELTFSPGGKRLAAAATDEGTRIWELPTASSPPLTPAKPAAPAGPPARVFKTGEWIPPVPSQQPLRKQGAFVEVSRDAEYQVWPIATPWANEGIQQLLAGLPPEQMREWAFHTQFKPEEAKQPHIIIRLKKPANLRQVAVENRKGTQFLPRSTGLTLWLSSDGNEWRQVWQAESPQAEWLIDLGVGQPAQYLKLGLPGKGVLHLREVVVYGDP